MATITKNTITLTADEEADGLAKWREMATSKEVESGKTVEIHSHDGVTLDAIHPSQVD